MNAFHNIDMYNFDSKMESTVTFSLNTHQAFPLCISNYEEWLKNLWNITLLVSNYSLEAFYTKVLLPGR